ncbi:26S proteasome subunit RPN7-domain-containing protein [Dipodascopsis uninucleata]
MASKNKEVKLIVNSFPTFDLESYVQGYSNYNAIDRLLFIADRCPPLAKDALLLAITTLKKTQNVTKYEEAVEMLSKVDSHDPLATIDKAWVDEVSRSTRSVGDKLELELKSYKNNLIKESIRMGYSELGDFYFKVGDLTSASKYYIRQREYCTTHKHIEDMSLDMIRVAVHQQNWSLVETSLARIDGLPSDKTDIEPIIKIVRGLLYLSQGNYSAAVSSFLDVKAESLINPSKSSRNNVISLNEFVTINDIATLVGLCMLASYDRNSLKSVIDDNPNFKEVLDSEPHVHTLIDAFIWFNYRTIFDTLEAHKNDYLLDIWLSSHVINLFSKIRENCYVQYVSGYKRGYLEKMAARFGVDRSEIEGELIELIMAGKVAAKIDLVNNYFIQSRTDERIDAYKKSLDVAKNYEQNARLLLVNVGVLCGGLEVNGAPDESAADTEQS